MTDWHDITTTYTYTDAGRLSTVSSPGPSGSRTWDVDYNALGQRTQVSIPNGMTTASDLTQRRKDAEGRGEDEPWNARIGQDNPIDAIGCYADSPLSGNRSTGWQSFHRMAIVP
jgi:hypothetical protein